MIQYGKERRYMEGRRKMRKPDKEGQNRIIHDRGIGLKGGSKKKGSPGVQTDVFSSRFPLGKSEDKLNSSRKIEVDRNSATPKDLQDRMNDQYNMYIERQKENSLTREWKKFGVEHADEIAEARQLKRTGESTTPILGSSGKERR